MLQPAIALAEIPARVRQPVLRLVCRAGEPLRRDLRTDQRSKQDHQHSDHGKWQSTFPLFHFFHFHSYWPLSVIRYATTSATSSSVSVPANDGIDDFVSIT